MASEDLCEAEDIALQIALEENSAQDLPSSERPCRAQPARRSKQQASSRIDAGILEESVWAHHREVMRKASKTPVHGKQRNGPPRDPPRHLAEASSVSPEAPLPERRRVKLTVIGHGDAQDDEQVTGREPPAGRLDMTKLAEEQEQMKAVPYDIDLDTPMTPCHDSELRLASCPIGLQRLDSLPQIAGENDKSPEAGVWTCVKCKHRLGHSPSLVELGFIDAVQYVTCATEYCIPCVSNLLEVASQVGVITRPKRTVPCPTCRTRWVSTEVSSATEAYVHQISKLGVRRGKGKPKDPEK
ncbi:uncharacterized protein I303_101204 [Kwoniella dejecticola CBS 10117]|uniref:Uncharacterized protein n=1 Tax=Kwoniella dejecticola CBS 10117 TaxID=1296121 RepID=A0A1A6AH92_9TREE|nr:uncharacterized protein I303_01210 [Kwoniella dejecticola CBS 10117]OBR89383.1 hypothetical protein I303_01210 [Kwoniella dejecticola CBS 10117]